MQKLGLTAGSTLRVIELWVTEVDSESLDSLFKRCPRLVTLTLAGDNFDTTDASVQTLVDHCPQLEELSLSCCHRLSHLSLRYMLSLPHLRDLRLTYGKGLTWSGVQEFVKNSPNLEVLHTKIVEGSADEVLRNLGMYCPRLRAFHCYKNAVTHDAVIALLHGCPLLEEVKIDEYSPNDQVLGTVAEWCPKMRLFSLGWRALDHFTGRGLIALSRGCPGLAELDLCCRDPVSDDAILRIAEYCRMLKIFTISFNDHVGNRSICALIKANPRLTRVSVSACQRINDDRCLVALASCPYLRSVYLTDIKWISKASFEFFVNSCQYFEEITLRDSDVSDAYVDAMARRCRRLKDVAIFTCHKVTERSILPLLTHGKRLSRIHMSDCNIVITKELRDRLNSLSPQVLTQHWLTVAVNSQTWHIYPKST